MSRPSHRLAARRTPDPGRLATAIARLESLEPPDRARLLADLRGLMKDTPLVDDLLAEHRAADDAEFWAPVHAHAERDRPT